MTTMTRIIRFTTNTEQCVLHALAVLVALAVVAMVFSSSAAHAVSKESDAHKPAVLNTSNR